MARLWHIRHASRYASIASGMNVFGEIVELLPLANPLYRALKELKMRG